MAEFSQRLSFMINLETMIKSLIQMHWAAVVQCCGPAMCMCLAQASKR